MAEYSFNEEAIAEAIKAAQSTHQNAAANNMAAFDISKGGGLQDGPLSIGAQCISVTTENHQICINLPLGIGKRCFSLPISIPEGSVGQACISICTTWGIPTGVRLTVVIAGITVVNQSFGKC